MESATSRRRFLKVGAVVAAPLAGDDSQARLTRLEDERAIEALHRAFVRRVNGEGDCKAFVAHAGSVTLEPGLRSIADDHARDATLEIAADGRSATSRRPVHVEIDSDFAGHSTLEQMHRFQGQGSHRRRETRVMHASYVKAGNAWQIARLRLD